MNMSQRAVKLVCLVVSSMALVFIFFTLLYDSNQTLLRNHQNWFKTFSNKNNTQYGIQTSKEQLKRITMQTHLESHLHSKEHLRPELYIKFQSKVKTSSTNQSDPLHIYGIDFIETKALLVGESSPWNFLENYKNPCWWERVPQNFEQQYKRGKFYSHGKKKVRSLIPVYKKALQSDRPWRLRCLPYLLLAGVTKSGTTDIYDSLNMHPDIHTGWVKEPMYWNRHKALKPTFAHANKSFGHWRFNNYVEQYDYAAYRISQNYNSKDEVHPGITMDGSSYLFWEDNAWTQHPKNVGLKEPVYLIMDDLHAILPQARIVVMMRNPTSRALSAFTMYNGERRLQKRLNKTSKAFHEYIENGIKLYEQCFKQHGIRACAYNVTLSCLLHPISLRPAFYSVYLREWRRVYGKDQIMVIRSEDYYENRMHHVRRIWNFLGLRKISHLGERIQEKKISFKRKYFKMLPETKQMLDKFYVKFNRELEDMLGRTMWS